MTYDEAAAEYGADALTGKNGKALAGLPLTSRIAKLEKEREANAAKVIAEQKAIDAAAFDEAKPGSKSNPLPADEPEIQIERTHTPDPAPAITSGAAAFISSRFAIEKNVPMPNRTRGVGSRADTKYPFAKMTDVGDSFFVPATAEMPKPWKTLSSLGSRMSKLLHPWSFTAMRIFADATRGTPEGCRVFRAADLTEPKQPRPVKAAA